MPREMTPELQAAARAAGFDPNSPDADEVEELESEVPEEDETFSEPPEGADSEPTSDLPDSFFGHDIKGFREKYGDEAAQEYYNTLVEADRAANKRIRELNEALRREEEEAQTQRRTVEPPAPEEPEEISDEDLLVRYGMSPDLLQYEDFGKPIVTMLRNQMRIEADLEAQKSAASAQEWERTFYGTFDRMQEQYGEIPDVDRRTLEATAVERQVFDPEALYWLLAGPVNRAAASRQGPAPRPPKSGDVRKLKKAVSNTRRRSAASGSVGEGKPKSLKEAFEAAKRQAGVDASTDPFAAEE